MRRQDTSVTLMATVTEDMRLIVTGILYPLRTKL